MPTTPTKEPNAADNRPKTPTSETKPVRRVDTKSPRNVSNNQGVMTRKASHNSNNNNNGTHAEVEGGEVKGTVEAQREEKKEDPKEGEDAFYYPKDFAPKKPRKKYAFSQNPYFFRYLG